MADDFRRSQLLADLPFDILLKIFSECDVDDILNLSTTCKRMNEVSGEHQTWLSQVRRLQITVPTDTIPSTAELKEWAISWLRSDERWVKPRTDDDDRLLVLHRFDMRKLVNEGRSVPFVMANLIPGGKFVVILYTDGQIDLKEIKTESEDNWDLRDVAEYIQDDPENTHTMFWSQLLTETNVGRPLIAYVDRDQENLFVFLVDHVAGVIEPKQVVKLDDIFFYEIYGIHARGNTILCFYQHGDGWGITVSELGPNPALKLFTLGTSQGLDPREIQLFMLSENAVVTCDPEGIHLYRIPDLGSAEGFSTLSPVWEWLAESKWFCGSVCTTFSRHPMLYLQGESGTHTITFRMDACGRDPIVSEHRISGELPAHLVSREGDDDLFVVKGRKGLCYDIGEGDIYMLDTCLLGKEKLAGGFSADANDSEVGNWDEHVMKFADFDERTGRIMIATRRYGAWGETDGTRICLGDLPP